MLFFACLLAFVNFNIAPLLPKNAIDQQFYAAEQKFAERWEVFQQDKEFVPFQVGRTDAELEIEFQEVDHVRHHVWYRNPESAIKESMPGYEISLPLIFQDKARCRNCLPFDYNTLTPYYNASAMNLFGRHSIACEGTRSKDIPHFYTLLYEYQVTHLVRLTASYEGENKKCHPYWDGLLTKGEDGEWILNVPMGDNISYPVQYFATDDWRDHSGIQPQKLLDLLLKVRTGLDEQKGLLTVHCSAGVGRTGTFLAGLAILDAIDQKIPFSIQEIVYRLSLQRAFSVAKPSQYITLHRLAEEYLQCSACSPCNLPLLQSRSD